MQREEPTTGLVHTLSDEISGIDYAVIKCFLVLKGIVNLCVRHGAAVEPHIDEIQFALQRLSARTYQHDIIHIRTVQVNAVVVLLAHIARHKALGLQRVLCHHASLHGLLNLVVELFNAADADLLACVAVAPDRQRCAPIAAAAEVPVVQVLQPFAEAARTC